MGVASIRSFLAEEFSPPRGEGAQVEGKKRSVGPREGKGGRPALSSGGEREGN